MTLHICSALGTLVEHDHELPLPCCTRLGQGTRVKFRWTLKIDVSALATVQEGDDSVSLEERAWIALEKRGRQVRITDCEITATDVREKSDG